MKKALLLVFLACFFAQAFAQVPVITALAPVSGPVGATVTITGTGFSAVAANNIVHFGGAVTKVITATTTKLTVKVPDGATYDPLSVTTGKLTGYSKSPFVVTFSDGNTTFTPTSFKPAVDLAMNNSLEYNGRTVVTADLDGDGKTDIAVNNAGTKAILILKNIRNGSGPVFNSTPTLILPTGLIPLQLTAADIDGDGLIDLSVINSGSSTISIYKNTSTTAGIAFAAKIDISTGATPDNFVISDIDGDGKPDIVVSSASAGTLSVYRNITDASGVKFAAKVDIKVSQPSYLTVGDLNRDGKPDLVVGFHQAGKIGILKNISTPGNIAFATETDFIVYLGPYKVTICDIDHDGVPDMVAGNLQGLCIYRNTTPVSGNFSFAPYVFMPLYVIPQDRADREVLRANPSYSESVIPNSITAGDIDGDGIPDLALTYGNSINAYSVVSVLRNLSTPGNIKLALNEEYAAPEAQTVAIADLDGDGKPDIAVGSREASTVFWQRNATNEPTITNYQTVDGISVTLTGTNLSKTTAVTVGGKPVTSFKVNSVTSIAVTVPAGSAGPFAVTTPYGTGTLPGFTSQAAPVITSINPVAGPPGTTVTITGSQFSAVKGATQVFFGSVKAVVTAATPTSLKVVVPFGSAYQPIKVTVNNLTGCSRLTFTTTFPGGGGPLVAASFAPKNDIKALPNESTGIVGCDFDGDGNTDLVISGSDDYNTAVTVYRNSGNKQTPFSIAPLYLQGTGNEVGLVGTDFDGDGKPDLVVANRQHGNFSLFKNTSSPGTISFSARADFQGYDYNNLLAAGDLDGDGKPDIVSVSYNFSYYIFSLYRNTTDNGVISFAHKIDYPSVKANDITMSDIDGDGKLDVIVSGDGGIDIFKNTSVRGTVSFAKPILIKTIASNTGIAAADFNGDGKPDLAVMTASNAVSTFKNTSTASGISFGPQTDYLVSTPTIISYVAVNDLDGDGKPEIMVSGKSNNVISIFKNNSTTSNLSFSPKVEYATGGEPQMIATGDFNKDGRPDIAVATYYPSGISILLNQVGLKIPVIKAYQITGIDPKSNVKLTGTNFTGTTALTFGGVTPTSYTVVSDSVITSLVNKTIKGTIALTNHDGSASLTGFTFPTPPVVSSYTSTVSGNVAKVVITGTFLAGATGVTFDNLPATGYVVNSATQITATVSPALFQTITVTNLGGSYTYHIPPVITSVDVKSAGQGATVHITGYGFTGATAVIFGNASAKSYTVVSPTSITATLGLAGGNSISVNTPYGYSTYNNFTFIPPVPTLTSFGPKTVAKGGTVIITGTNFINITSVTFGGTPASSFQVNSPTSIYAFVGAGSTGNLAVTNASGTATATGFIFKAAATTGMNSLYSDSTQMLQPTIVNAPYPNPFTDVVYINLTDVLSGDLKIFNLSNNTLVFTKHLKNQSGLLRLDLPRLGKGVYTLILPQSSGKSAFKIIKQ